MGFLERAEERRKKREKEREERRNRHKSATKNSPLGNLCGSEPFVSLQRTASPLHSPKSSQPTNLIQDTRILNSNISGNFTAMAGSLDSNGNLESSENLKLSLRENKTNEAIYKNAGFKDSKHLDSNLYCHDSANAASRNDKIVESNFERSEYSARSAINATKSQTTKSVVGGEGESCERGRGERLRVCAKHQPTLANLSPLSLSQSEIISGEATHRNKMHESNEVAARIKKSENEAERKIESSGLPRSLATSRNDKQVLDSLNNKQILDSHNIGQNPESHNNKNTKSLKDSINLNNATNPLKNSTKNKNLNSQDSTLLAKSQKNSTIKSHSKAAKMESFKQKAFEYMGLKHAKKKDKSHKRNNDFTLRRGANSTYDFNFNLGKSSKLHSLLNPNAHEHTTIHATHKTQSSQSDEGFENATKFGFFMYIFIIGLIFFLVAVIS